METLQSATKLKNIIIIIKITIRTSFVNQTIHLGRKIFKYRADKTKYDINKYITQQIYETRIFRKLCTPLENVSPCNVKEGISYRIVQPANTSIFIKILCLFCYLDTNNIFRCKVLYKFLMITKDVQGNMC